MRDLTLSIEHYDGKREQRRLEPGRLGVGRDRGNWLCPVDPSMSRHHAVLVVEDSSLWIEALETRNPTSVDGIEIEGRWAVELGSLIVCAATRLVITESASDELRQAPTRDLQAGALPAGFIARSAAMVALLETARKVAASKLPVLIQGESGVGKEVLARFIHDHSGVASGPWEILNCPALPESLIEAELFGVEAGVATEVKAREGLLEQADGGTLLLDEVADLPLAAQSKLLRFLADGELTPLGGRRSRSIDVRILAATNKKLEAEIEAGRFRADLYYRIAGVEMVVPPLRERCDDIAAIARQTLREQGGMAIADEALDALEAYDFPGNVRELEAILRRAAVLATGSRIEVDDLGLGAAAKPRDRDSGRALAAGMEAGSLDFWDDIHRPFMARELPRETLAALVDAGLEQAGTVKALAERWGTADRYRKLLDFLRNQGFLA